MRRAPWTALTLLALTLGAPSAAGLTFEDAEGTGLAFRHAVTDLRDADGNPFPINYPETNGSGVCWGDVDLDGVDDVFWVNGKYSNASLQATFDPRSALYLNDGDGTFTDATLGWGVAVSGWGQGCSLADYDGDADPDLLVVGYDLLQLFRNDRDRFTEVAAAANLSLTGKCGVWPDDNTLKDCFAESGSWADYDRDGDLDLYVANMVDYDLEKNASDPITPTMYDGQPNILFRNRGDGTFEDVTAAAGVDDDPSRNHSKSFMSLWADDDRDGDLDLYIASDTTANTLFRNRGDGTFTDVAAAAGVADPRSSMGLVFADLGHDGCPDLYMTHYAAEDNGFYQNRCDGTFADRSGEADDDPDADIGWGTGFHDFDHDGDLDIYAVNGHTSPVFPDQKQLARLWLQAPNGTFADASRDAGPSFQDPSVARGSAVADYDLDGDLDIAVLANFNETARLFRNVAGATGHWLQVELRQPSGMNRFALGAEVQVTPEGGRPVTRTLQAGSSFLSQDSLVVHAGLGGATRADVRVRWPDGAVETWAGIAHAQRVRLVRGDATVHGDTLAPRTTIVLEGEGRDGWFRGGVTARLEAADRAMGQASGLVATEIRIEGGPWSPYAGPAEFQGEGLREVRGRSRDAAGNQEPARSAWVRIDATAPSTATEVVGQRGEDGWFAKMAAVHFRAADALSGVARVWSRIDGGAWEAGPSRVVRAPGVHAVDFYAEDVAGNLEAVRTLTVKVDDAAPSAAFRAPVWVGVGTMRLDVEASDAASGVRRVHFFVGAEAAPRFTDADGSDGWSWTLRDPGAHLVRAVAVDAVGYEAEDAAVAALAPAPPPLLALLAMGLAVGRRR